jgi:hypothetical protein
MTALVERAMPARRRLSRAAFLQQVGAESAQAELGWLGESAGVSLTRHFQRCTWQRLSVDLRLGVLHRAEQLCTDRYVAQTTLHQKNLAIRLNNHHIRTRMWNKWMAWTRLAARIRQCRQAAYLRRARSGIRAWHRQVVQVHWDRLNEGASRAIGEAYKKRERLVRVRGLARFQQKVRKVERAMRPDIKRIRDGLMHLRAAWRSARLRQALNVWFEHAWMDHALDAAEAHRAAQLSRRVLHGLWRYATVERRRREQREYEERMREEARERLVKSIADTEEELMARKRREEEAAERKRQEVGW